MTVGFYLLDTKTLDSMCGYACARALTRSVREVMPGVPVVHFTDEQSPKVDGVDEVIRKLREPMARLRMRHHAEVAGDWLFLDTDVLVQRDVRAVFRDRFDVAITIRDWPHVKPAVGFTERMPFNMGVVFSRSPAFWRDVYIRMMAQPKDLQRWMGDQEAFCQVLADRHYRIRRLSGTRFNFPPSVDAQDTKSQTLEAAASIVHFKGPQRKPMMLSRIGETVPCA